MHRLLYRYIHCIDLSAGIENIISNTFIRFIQHLTFVRSESRYHVEIFLLINRTWTMVFSKQIILMFALKEEDRWLATPLIMPKIYKKKLDFYSKYNEFHFDTFDNSSIELNKTISKSCSIIIIQLIFLSR